jgi:hypothetical protein
VLPVPYRPTLPALPIHSLSLAMRVVEHGHAAAVARRGCPPRECGR